MKEIKMLLVAFVAGFISVLANANELFDTNLETSASVVATDDSITSQDKAYSWYLDERERNDWVYGREVGFENQLETVEGDNFVQRNFLRYQATRDKTFPISEGNQNIHVEVKGGPMIGHYIGASATDPDAKYGDKKSIRTGLTGEAVATYNIDTKYVDPFIGLSADAELMTQPRIEWQADAVAGIKFNVAKDKDLALRYQHTLLHKFHYFYDEDKTFKQNNGFAVGLIGTKYNRNGTSHSIRLEYERFDKGDITYFGNGWSGYEPKTENWLLSYKKTF